MSHPIQEGAASQLRQGSLRVRGGLGRTLLTAFLILAIGPLSVVGMYAITRARAESLNQHYQLLMVATDDYAAQFDAWQQHQVVALQSAALREPPPLWPQPSKDNIWFLSNQTEVPTDLAPYWLRLRAGEAYIAPEGILWLAMPHERGFWLASRPLPSLLDLRLGMSDSGPLSFLGVNHRVMVATGGKLWCLDQGDDSCVNGAIEAYLQQPEPENPLHMSPFASAWGREDELLIVQLPLRRVVDGVVLVSQPRAEALRASENLAAALIGAILLAALLTAVSAAVITRQITRPIFELTRTVVLIARGDLAKRVPVTRQDELGVLSIAFNAMANRLQDLLTNLEQRVADRTAELQIASAQIERRARQLALSADLGRELATLDQIELVVMQAMGMIRERFGYAACGIWVWGEHLGDPQGVECYWRLALPEPSTPAGELMVTLAKAVASDGLPRGTTPEGLCVPLTSGVRLPVLGLPLRLGDLLVGALLLEDHTLGFDAGDSQALQTLADQVTVAIESAQAAEIERTVVNKLRELRSHQATYLGEMSHELGTALNSIIGFSSLMLKEVEGPLTEMQRSDLTFINRNGKHLLSLLDGMLDVLEIDHDGASNSHPGVEDA